MVHEGNEAATRKNGTMRKITVNWLWKERKRGKVANLYKEKLNKGKVGQQGKWKCGKVKCGIRKSGE